MMIRLCPAYESRTGLFFRRRNAMKFQVLVPILLIFLVACGTVAAQTPNNQPAVHYTASRLVHSPELEHARQQSKKPKLVLQHSIIEGCCNRYDVLSNKSSLDWILHESVMNGIIHTPNGDGVRHSIPAQVLAEIDGAELIFLDERLQVNPPHDNLQGVSPEQAHAILTELDQRVRAALSQIYDLAVVETPAEMRRQ